MIICGLKFPDEVFVNAARTFFWPPVTNASLVITTTMMGFAERIQLVSIHGSRLAAEQLNSRFRRVFNDLSFSLSLRNQKWCRSTKTEPREARQTHSQKKKTQNTNKAFPSQNFAACIAIRIFPQEKPSRLPTWHLHEDAFHVITVFFRNQRAARLQCPSRSSDNFSDDKVWLSNPSAATPRTPRLFAPNPCPLNF